MYVIDTTQANMIKEIDRIYREYRTISVEIYLM